MSEAHRFVVDFVGHGAYAHQFMNGDADGTGIKVRFNVAGRPYGVHAIVTRPSGTIEVARLQAGQDYTFEDFTRIGFAVANVGSEGNTVSWTVEGTTLGVEDYRSTPEFGLQNVAPNPTAGSGVIVSPAGHVLTNYHVAADAVEITCRLPTNEAIPATVIAHDPLTDLSILKLTLEKRTCVVSLSQSSSSPLPEHTLLTQAPLVAGTARARSSESSRIVVFMARSFPAATARQRGSTGFLPAAR